MIIEKKYALSVIVSVALVMGFVPSAGQAQTESVEALDTLPEEKIVFLNDATVAKGFTIGAADGEVLVGVPPRALSASATVGLQFELIDVQEVSEGFSAPAWAVKLAIDDGVDMLKPFTLIYEMDSLEYVPVIARWDDARMEWENLSTTFNWKNKEARTPLKQMGMYALFFDTAHHLKGKATWYPDRLSKDSPFACASNEYPLRTKLKVTNVQTKESVVVQVQSVGPFVRPRILDLTKTAFSKIGYPRKQGVLEVVVELVDKK